MSFYYNQLGDEIIFPFEDMIWKKSIDLIIKHLFTINILVIGRPKCGKSELINKLLGKDKCYAGARVYRFTERISKYIIDKYPIQIYDTPGLDKLEDYSRIHKFIIEKINANRIHFIFYIQNSRSRNAFIPYEFELIKNLIEKNIDIYFIFTHAYNHSEEDKLPIKYYLKKNIFDKSNLSENWKDHIFFIELNKNKPDKNFGLNKLFSSIYEKYKYYKYSEEITPLNLNEIKSCFIYEINSREKLKTKLSILSREIKIKFKCIASFIKDSPYNKYKSLLIGIIKIISNIYKNPLTTEQCIKYIEKHGFQSNNNDNIFKAIQKGINRIFNGSISKQIDVLAENLIEEYNRGLNDDKKFYEYLNIYNDSINFAIECLKEIKD